MTNDPSADDPEPIEAEFEPTYGEGAKSASPAGKTAMRRRNVTWVELGIGMVVSAVAGAGIATVMNGGVAGVSGGTLSTEINSLTSAQQSLTARADQVSEALVALRARVDSQGEQITARQAGDLELRRDIEATTQQLAVLAGEGDSETASNVSPDTPLGRLMARLKSLEDTISDESASPQTTRQMQRSLRTLTQKVEALDEASVDLTTASERRRASITALEQGLERLQTELNSTRNKFASVEDVETGLGAVRRSVNDLANTTEADRAPIIAAAEESRTIRAIAALETAAQKGGAFVQQHRTLAGLKPGDPDVTALADIARRGAPTLEQLRVDFTRSAERAEFIAAGQVNDGWGWLRGAMSGIVTVRRTDADDATLRIITQARSSLDSGDIRATLQAVSELSGEAANAMSNWREKAERRAQLDERLDALNANILADASVADGEN